MYLFDCDKFKFTNCIIFGDYLIPQRIHVVSKGNLLDTSYEIKHVKVQANIVNSGFNSELKVSNCENVFWFDRTPKSRVITSNNYFVLDIKEMLCALQLKTNYPVSFEVTDLNYLNQTWIKVDHVKYLINVVEFENNSKSIIVLIKEPIYYSLEFEIIKGICKNNCTTCKVDNESNNEFCIDILKSDSVISSKEETNNSTYSIGFKCMILYFLIVCFILILIFVIIWIKQRCLQNILYLFQPDDANPITQTNEITGVSLNFDPFKDFIKTSFMPNSLLKNHEINNQLELQRIASGEKS